MNFKVKFLILLLALSLPAVGLVSSVLGADMPQIRYLYGTGKSMSPTLSGDDYLRVEMVPFSSLEIGDIVVYHNLWGGKSLTCHRILRKGLRKDSFIMRGDGNNSNDMGLLTARNYRGKVTKIFGAGPHGQYLSALDALNHSGIVFAPSK